jgi:hypothetical protein
VQLNRKKKKKKTYGETMIHNVYRCFSHHGACLLSCLLVVMLSPLIVPLLCCSSHPVSCHHPAGAGAGSVVTSPPCHHKQAAPAIPPYKQLLKGMGVGAVSSAVAWCGAWMALAVSTCDPPHEQLLVGMGWMFVRCRCQALGKEVGASSA